MRNWREGSLRSQKSVGVWRRYWRQSSAGYGGVARYLERQGWLARDEQNEHLTLLLEEGYEDTLQQLQGHSITYRIAMGPQAGRKVLTLQTIPVPHYQKSDWI